MFNKISKLALSYFLHAKGAVKASLPENHWIFTKNKYDDDDFRKSMKIQDKNVENIRKKIRNGAEWAIRASTPKGKEVDFDPDLFLENLVLVFCPSAKKATANDIGFFIGSFPLPKDHWIYDDNPKEPPKNAILGGAEIEDKIREAGKYAVRGCTFSGMDMDFDPDAMIQNLTVSLIGPYDYIKCPDPK